MLRSDFIACQLEAALFLILFMGYLAITWALAHRAHCRVFQSQVSVRAYVSSNLMFSIPVLLPWFLLSLVSDLILALPFQTPKQILSTTAGEISYFLLFLLFVAFFGPAIIHRFWRCKPLQTGPQRTHIEALCRRARLKYKDILLWPIFEGRMITAGVRIAADIILHDNSGRCRADKSLQRVNIIVAP